MAVTVTDCTEITDDHWIYTVDFFGTIITTTVTSRPAVIRRWVRSAIYYLRKYYQDPVIGLGVQWTNYPDSDYAATLQLCVDRYCLIVQLLHTPAVPAVLRRFLLDPAYTFVGVWNHSDAWRLEECNHGLGMARQPVDLRLCVPGMQRASFERIVGECLGYYGVRLEKEISTSDWEETVLDDDQVRQATVDAYASFRIGLKFDI